MLENAQGPPCRAHAMLGDEGGDDSPFDALLLNSRVNPIDDFCASEQFHEDSQHLTSHAKFSPSSCPSLTHPLAYPNSGPAALKDSRFPPHVSRRLLR